MEQKQKKYKVVRIFSRLNIGGPSFHVVNLTKGLVDFGFETDLILGRTNLWEGDLLSYAKTQKVQPIFIDEFGVKISPIKDLITFIKIFNFLRLNKPDILHTHTFKAGLLGRLAGLLSGVPIIIHTYHGHLLNSYWSGWKILTLKFIEGSLAKISDFCIGVSSKVSDDLVQANVVHQSKMKTVELGFDIQYLQQQMQASSTLRKKLNIPKNHFVFGSACRLVSIKNMELLLVASFDILKKYPNSHLVIIGQGPEKERLLFVKDSFIKAHPDQKSQIHFVDWLVPFQCEFKDFDLYICSSKNEGTSVSVIEAMIAEVPVISTCVGGMPDLLNNGELGVLIESENIIQLTQAIENQLLKNKLDQQKELKIISKSVTNRFSADRLCRDIVAIYKQALKNKKLI